VLVAFLFSCNNETISLEAELDSIEKDSIRKSKSHIDSEIFVDSVMEVLNEAIKPQ